MKNKVITYTEKYSNNPVLRGLIQLVPFGIGSAIDVSIVTTLENIHKKRVETFFDEVSKNNLNFDVKLLESEDFLYKYFVTVDLALKTRQKEKIKMFAQLFKNGHDINSDLYEDYLKILDELSYREISALKILDKYSSTVRTAEQNDLVWSNQFWNDFENELSEKLDIPQNQIADFMTRITRTGCYEMFRGEYVGHIPSQGKLTPTFKKLKSFVYDRGTL